MDYDIDDEVTINGKWYLIEDVETDQDGTFYLLQDQDGGNRWAKVEDFD